MECVPLASSNSYRRVRGEPPTRGRSDTNPLNRKAVSPPRPAPRVNQAVNDGRDSTRPADQHDGQGTYGKPRRWSHPDVEIFRGQEGGDRRRGGLVSVQSPELGRVRQRRAAGLQLRNHTR